jgi:hypothetical protein
MKTTEDSKPKDWQARLHSLPSATEPASPVVSWLLRAFLCLGLFLVGSVFVLMSGTYVGLTRGIGPEQTGGVLYVLLGLVLNIFAGAGIAAFAARRSTSRSVPRLVFYSFTAPAFLAVILLALSFAEHLFQ